MGPKNVMTIAFVCTINRWRSVTAEYLFKNLLEEKDKALAQKIKVLSAGIVLQKQIDELKHQDISVPDPLWGYRPMPCLIFYMAKRGIDIAEHRSRPLDWDIAHKAELIVSMTEAHKDAIFTAFPCLRRDTLVSLPELSRPFEQRDIVNEPPGLMPPSHFCMCECDHWWYSANAILEIEERLKEAKDKILHRLVVQDYCSP